MFTIIRATLVAFLFTIVVMGPSPKTSAHVQTTQWELQKFDQNCPAPPVFQDFTILEKAVQWECNKWGIPGEYCTPIIIAPA